MGNVFQARVQAFFAGAVFGAAVLELASASPATALLAGMLSGAAVLVCARAGGFVA